MRVLTLNLWGYNNPYDYTLDRGTTRGAVPGIHAAESPASSWPIRRGLIAELLSREQPDLVALQEVAIDPAVEEGRDSAHQIADLLGWNALVATSTKAEGKSDNGVAVLSPHVIREIARIPLPDDRGCDSHMCLATQIVTPQYELVFLTAHFALAAGERRAHQIESVRRILAFCHTLAPVFPVVLAGDLNAEPFQDPVRLLLGQVEDFRGPGHFHDAQMLANGHTFPTMPSHAPAVTLDYILVRNFEAVTCWAAGGPNTEGYYPSDHLALIADLRPSWQHKPGRKSLHGRV